MFASKDLFFSKPSGYQISRSVRFRASATAYFNRTPASTGNRKAWTWSGWVKLGVLSTDRVLFSATNGTTFDQLRYSSTDNSLQLSLNNGTYNINTSALFRDPSSWYHVLFYCDTTNATNTERIQIWVNGIRQAVTSATYPVLNYDTYVNSTNAHQIGRVGTSGYFDGYMTEVNFLDGVTTNANAFGETNAITGVWQPLKYTGTYGTNGFYLNFSDNSNNTATTIGKDYSGNGNNWTPNNISVTAGATYDSMLDVPTLFADGGNGRGNYAVLNPLLNSGYSTTYSEGNLQLSGSFGVGQSSIFVNSGKWYVEMSYSAIGGTPTLVGPLGSVAGVSYQNDGNKNINSTITSYGATYTTGDLIGCAFDVDSGTTEFFKNGASQGVITQPLGTSVMFRTSSNAASGTNTLRVNFGQRPFTYTPPTGFVALNTQNLPSPTISNGANYMAATTYTGTGSALTIANTVNGISFQPDFVWVKGRSGATDHALYDSVRGVQKQVESNTTTAETTETTGLTAFGSTGFTVGALAQMNTNAATYVGWQWLAGTTSSSNTNGSITSTVSVGATQGFSVVTYTGTGANATVGHGLGVAPSMIIAKRRNGVQNWLVGSTALGWTKALNLDLADAPSTTITAWNNTAPTSSVFSIGTFFLASTYVAYCFSEVAGYSKFGSYTGNGSTDGPFVFCGFRPRWIMIKRTDAVGDWQLRDTSRDPINGPNGNALLADVSSAEAATLAIDYLSNGFKFRDTGGFNTSSATYIYMAFAENPTKFSLAR